MPNIVAACAYVLVKCQQIIHNSSRNQNTLVERWIFMAQTSMISHILIQPTVYRLDSTLGLLPKIPFKLTQSIHVAIQKSCNFDWKLLKLFIF